jgi:hypothetical protein
MSDNNQWTATPDGRPWQAMPPGLSPYGNHGHEPSADVPSQQGWGAGTTSTGKYPVVSYCTPAQSSDTGYQTPGWLNTYYTPQTYTAPPDGQTMPVGTFSPQSAPQSVCGTAGYNQASCMPSQYGLLPSSSSLTPQGQYVHPPNYYGPANTGGPPGAPASHGALPYNGPPSGCAYFSPNTAAPSGSYISPGQQQ